MFNVVRNLATNVNKRNAKEYLKKSKPKFSKNVRLKTMPIFKYPVSKGDCRVYVWGLQEHGALGTIKKVSFGEEGVAFIGTPHRLSFAEYHKILDITCGYGFTVYAVQSKDNKILYGSGINSDSQLGYHPLDEKLKIPIIKEPRPIYIPLKEKTTKVLGLAAGRAHLLILTDEGLFTLGNNGYGQCGRPIIGNENYVKSKVVHCIPNVEGAKITAVTAGQDHSILLTENGEVYTFGWGADGQTGLAHYHNQYKPELVKGDLVGQKIVKVSCTADCVLALSDNGKVFAWGNSEYGQIPTCKDNQQVNVATELKIYEKLGHIVDIAAGGSFCMVLNSSGIVYVWGFGILGLGPEAQRVTEPTSIPSILFGTNISDPNTSVAKIFCGISHLGALTADGQLYMWGRNKFGALGLGHRKDQFFPLKVSVGAKIKKVACGVDHTVSICKPFI
ncbi:PREDICTED: Williams-Beuren syndrome chromosomal region 16 protein homolog [Ceratosolen solmsi marchali]|uniref:Williams-Beuren syndrome chromosomal region 16 protein homolog n=1 Tax=Ceratosolen solmsi marchali TaxID=326594 RepID=A0AAJ7DYZ3_9HYME|nr:PREDICTED: Williams-Beuren syndrome chromosomal region 16 protein homolog [Ceratosolen solmsi marchali]